MNLDVRLNIFIGTLAFIQNTGKDYLCTLFLNCKYHLTYQSYKIGLPSSTTGHKESPACRQLVHLI